ncbi:MAG: hypothetical protein KL863_27790 [Rhizobium sp.]|nr:hypothetical protein [Rhizobium sp.]
MKIAIATAATLLAASSFAFAADNNGGKDGKDGMMDNSTTGSIQSQTKDSTGGIDDATECREGTAGGPLCQEPGTAMPQ